MGLWVEAGFLLAVFLVYLRTIAPFLYWRDAPEFIDAVNTLGIAHPAGFPSYSLMARWACLLPLGNIPFRINLFSVLCSVAALGIFLRTSQRILVARGAGEGETRLISVGAAGILAVGRHSFPAFPGPWLLDGHGNAPDHGMGRKWKAAWNSPMEDPSSSCGRSGGAPVGLPQPGLAILHRREIQGSRVLDA